MACVIMWALSMFSGLYRSGILSNLSILPIPALGDMDLLALLVDGVVACGFGTFAGFGGFTFLQATDQLGVHVIQVGGFFGGPRNDQRRAGLVDQDAVYLVHDGEVQRRIGTQGQGVAALGHVVAQIVETQLGVGDVGDIAAVGGLLLRGLQLAAWQVPR